MLLMLKYSCFVCEHKCEINYLHKKYVTKSTKTSNTPDISIYGFLRSTPTIPFDTLCGTVPIELQIDLVATMTAIRLQTDSKCLNGLRSLRTNHRTEKNY